MKIYILPIERKYLPKKQKFKYPSHNLDYGVEQDFYLYLKKNKYIISNDPQKADWHYLPMFWTRWHLNHNYGKNNLDELQKEVDKKILDDSKTFTICQYDDGPIIDLRKTIIFLSSRKTRSGIDIPLLCSPHQIPFFNLQKKYTASFIGRLSTHIIRENMAKNLLNKNNFLIKDGNWGTKYFVKNTLMSFVSLCPRGYGGSSFRLFEAMQLGVVPFLIGDIDTRPFKNFIEWDKISFYSNNVKEIEKIIKSYSKETILQMGHQAKKAYKEKLSYQKWCPLLIEELKTIK